MEYRGEERRKNQGFCNQHITFVSDLAVIKNSIQNIERSLTDNVTFRRSIYSMMFGVIVTIIIQICGFSFVAGQISNQVKVNTERLTVLENGK